MTSATGPAPTRDRAPLAQVLTANAISLTGNALTLVGVPWFALETTGSAAKAGLVAFCAMAPVAVAAVFGGPLIDRVGRRRVSVASDLVCALAVAAIPLLHRAGALEFWTLCVLMAVTGLCHAPGETARNVLLPDLAETAGISLARAASLFDAVSRGARMAGAALAGVLIAFAGAETVLLVDAATFALSAAVISLGIRRLAAAAPRPGSAPVSAAHYRRELREGRTALTGDRLLFSVVLLVMLTNALDQSWSAVLLPVHTREHLGGPTDLGLLVSLFAGSALLGALLYAAFGDRFPRRTVFAVAFLVSSPPRFAVAALTDTTFPLALTMVLGGLGAGVLNPVLSTVMYERIPEALRSRVLGVITAGTLMATPLGGLVAGPLVERVGLTATLLLVAVVYLLATLSVAVFPVWRRLDGGPPPERCTPPRSSSTPPAHGVPGEPAPSAPVPLPRPRRAAEVSRTEPASPRPAPGGSPPPPSAS
ncbi:MFS transporter [Streptomyces sp. NPDC057638]|uniref:MFS transporter n=1 Tax=Streptomyces sp. NPDC057638 TaxID=3346190 RepID=UPI0036BF65F8